MSDTCRICLQSGITGTRPVDTLLEFHHDLCEKDVHANLDVMFCSTCEELLKNFYDFRLKCRQSNEIFKNTCVPKNNDGSQSIQNENNDSNTPEHKFTQHDHEAVVKIEKYDTQHENNTALDKDIDIPERHALIDLKVEETYIGEDIIFNDYDDIDIDYIPEKTKKKKRKKEQITKKEHIPKKEKKNKTSKGQTTKCKKIRLKDRILELMKLGEFQDLGEGVAMSKDLFLKMYDKSHIGSVRCTILLQDPGTKEELDRLRSFLLYLLNKNNPEYDEMFIIEILDTAEKKLEEFRSRKLTEEYVAAQFKCHVCYKVFDAHRLLEYHRRWHEPRTGTCACDICGMRFARRKSLAQHSKDNHCAVYRCTLCPLLTYNFSVMVSHYHHHKGKEYSCPVCLSVFSNKSTMNNHRLQAHKTSHICPLCARCFVSEKGLYFHKQLKHKNEDETKLSASVSCDKCGVTLTSQEVLDAHTRQMHGAVTIHKCFQCKDVFRSLEELKKHKVAFNHLRSQRTSPKYTIDDNTIVPVNGDEKPYCKECDKAFNTRKGYLRHYNLNHNVNRIHKCGFCQAKFTTSAEIEAHRAAYNHHLKVRYVKRTGRIEGGVKVARTEKPFDKCALCGEMVGTGRVNGMYQHFVTSHPDTPYSSVYSNPHNRHLCELCGKTFKDLRFFLDHRNLHTGEKPYRCGVCSRTYATKRHLTWHAERHGPPRHQCRECGKLFNSAGNLFAHRRSHVGDRRFKCEICSKGFLHQAALNEHVRGVHNHIRRTRKCRDK